MRILSPLFAERERERERERESPRTPNNLSDYNLNNLMNDVDNLLSIPLMERYQMICCLDQLPNSSVWLAWMHSTGGGRCSNHRTHDNGDYKFF